MRRYAIAGAMLAGLFLLAAPAGAEVTGPCDGTASWDSGLTVTASQTRVDDPITIPLEGTVSWTGAVAIDPPSEPREISGWVKVKLPFPIGQVTVGEWSGEGTGVSSEGTYEYELPSLLSGFDMTVTGKHWEGSRTFAGAATCEGTVTFNLEGTNPLGFIAGGLTVIAIGGSYLAVKAKGPSAGGAA